MNNIQFIDLLINSKNKRKIIRLLNKHRISINQSKYC